MNTKTVNMVVASLYRFLPKCRTRHRLRYVLLLLSITAVAYYLYIRKESVSQGETFHTNVGYKVHPKSSVDQVEAVLLLGNVRKEKKFLTIGIPTVFRTGRLYLFDTLDFLLSKRNSKPFRNVTIVVQLSDSDKIYRHLVINNIWRNYVRFIKDGVLELTEVSHEIYPSLENLERNFNDSVERVQWRSKQALDYAYLMNYCKNKSEYYLHLEDDVEAADDYIKKIHIFISENRQLWYMLEFTFYGSVGKLFRTSDLPEMILLLKTHYWKLPADFLFQYFLDKMKQKERYVRLPTLFRHIGKMSSLPGQVREYIDPFFYLEPKHLKGDNPVTTLTTNLETFRNFSLQQAYSPNTSGFFWGFMVYPESQIDIVFDRPQLVDRFILESGFQSGPEKFQDFIEAGILEFSSDNLTMSGRQQTCKNYEVLGKLMNGRIEVSKIYKGEKHFDVITCFRIRITEPQRDWILIREIAIFTLKI